MQRIIDFFLGNKLRLLFWCYLLIGIVLTSSQNLYFKSSYLNTSGQISGGIHLFFSGITDYFSLASENKFLSTQNKVLLERLTAFKQPALKQNSAELKKNFEFINGRIIKNSFTGIDNYLTLSLGKQDSVSTDMGVVNEKGLLGIIEFSGNSFSTVQSILHSKSKINVKVKGADYFGSLIWDGKNPNRVQLTDIPDLAPIKKGDTIISGGMSSIFPEDIPVGTIEDFKLTAAKDYYLIQVRLVNDMQNIGPVYVIKNQFKKEIKAVENNTDE